MEASSSYFLLDIVCIKTSFLKFYCSKCSWDVSIIEPMPCALTNQSEYFDAPSVEVLILSPPEGKPISTWVQPVEGEPLNFELVSQQIELSPFYSLNHQHYMFIGSWKRSECKTLIRINIASKLYKAC